MMMVNSIAFDRVRDPATLVLAAMGSSVPVAQTVATDCAIVRFSGKGLIGLQGGHGGKKPIKKALF